VNEGLYSYVFDDFIERYSENMTSHRVYRSGRSQAARSLMFLGRQSDGAEDCDAMLDLPTILKNNEDFFR